MSFRYKMCQLTIGSNVEFPELEATALDAKDSDVDLQVRFAESEGEPKPYDWFITWNLPNGNDWLSCARLDGGYLLRFPTFGEFEVDSGGREVTCRAGSKGRADTLRHLFLDQVFPLILNLRGQDALHATAVLTPLGVCAFMGPAGTGKSTLAASFMHTGYPVLSDDCFAIEQRAEKAFALPAYPGVRVWTDSREAVFGKGTAGSTVAHYTSKARVTDGCGNFPTTPQPLVCIYVLANEEQPGAEGSPDSRENSVVIGPMPPREALMALIRCAFRLDVNDKQMVARQFRSLHRLSQMVPVRRLHNPRNFSSLGAVRKAVLSDLEQIRSDKL
jgi:hypothetical protein